jgi:hypothetical protein
MKEDFKRYADQITQNIIALLFEKPPVTLAFLCTHWKKTYEKT